MFSGMTHLSEVLIPAIENFYNRNGHCPERVLADKIYRNRANLDFCKEHGIRLAGPALGRPGKNAVIDRHTEYIDSVDRIEVECKFGLSKHSHGLGLTSESQAKWYESYLTRFDDIYWCIYNKQNQFIGTVRVYDIDEENDICDQGSLMIDEDYVAGGPYAVEVELLTLDFIFGILKIGKVINEDRADNKVMNNLTKKLGFKFVKDTKIGEVDYKYYLLSPEDYNEKRKAFAQIVDYWNQR